MGLPPLATFFVCAALSLAGSSGSSGIPPMGASRAVRCAVKVGLAISPCGRSGAGAGASFDPALFRGVVWTSWSCTFLGAGLLILSTAATIIEEVLDAVPAEFFVCLGVAPASLREPAASASLRCAETGNVFAFDMLQEHKPSRLRQFPGPVASGGVAGRAPAAALCCAGDFDGKLPGCGGTDTITGCRYAGTNFARIGRPAADRHDPFPARIRVCLAALTGPLVVAALTAFRKPSSQGNTRVPRPHPGSLPCCGLEVVFRRVSGALSPLRRPALLSGDGPVHTLASNSA